MAQLAALAYRGLFIWMIYKYRYFSPAGQSVFRIFAYVVLAHMLVGQGYQWLQAELAARGRPMRRRKFLDDISLGFRTKTVGEARAAMALMAALCAGSVIFLSAVSYATQAG